MNLKLLRKIVKHIKANPDTWRQSAWHCGTSHCVAGFAELDAAGYSLGSAAFNSKLDAKRWWDKPSSGSAWYTRTRFWRFIQARRKQQLPVSTCSIAQDHLRITDRQADYLFSASRSLDQLSEVARTGRFPDQY
jgi:hypothetical protein